jgi:hypothetical protein
MQCCSRPLAKIACIQNDHAQNLWCVATPLIHSACRHRAGYVAPEPEPVARIDDYMTDVISRKWDWSELRDVQHHLID